MRHHARDGSRAQGGQAADDPGLGCRPHAGRVADRDRLEGVDVPHLDLRRLHVDQMRHARLWVQPVGRRGLPAARQRGQHVVGNQRLVDADAQSEAAVGVQPQGRLVHDLLDADVGRACDLADARRHLHREGMVRIEVAPADLDVDRRGQAEVEDLRGDVARQEAELRAREALGQPRPQGSLVGRNRRGLIVQRHRQVAVLGPDRAARAVSLVDPGRGQAAVQQAADDMAGQQLVHLLVHQDRELGRFLDAGAGGEAHVQLERAGLDAGEEVLPDEDEERQGRQGERQVDGAEQAAPGRQPFEQPAIPLAKALEPCLEATVEPREDALLPGQVPLGARRRHLAAQQEVGHGRRQRARQDEGRDHREDHGLGQRQEQVPGDAAQLEQRQPHDADAGRGHQGRHDDLVGGLDDGGPEIHLPAGLPGRFEMRVDVLDHDRGVVHQDADRERQAVEGHDVDVLSHGRQAYDRGQDGERDGGGDDQGRAPASDEDQHRQTGEDGRRRHLLHHVLDGRAYELRGVIPVAVKADPCFRRDT